MFDELKIGRSGHAEEPFASNQTRCFNPINNLIVDTGVRVGMEG
jgi:hypothetical protein